jgi:hypothetical protein
VSLAANASPDPGETGMPLGLSLRLRFAAGEAPRFLFERAHAGEASRDGALVLQSWAVSDRREGAGGRRYAVVSLAFAAPFAFLEALAAKPRATFELGPGQDREIADFKHGARKMEFSLARAGDVIGDLRRRCGPARGN